MYQVHPSSYIDEDVTIGEGTKIWHFCHVQRGAVIGENCSLGQNVNIGNNVKIGNGVRIQNNVSVYEGVELEDNVFCGPSCVFTNVLVPRAHFPNENLMGRGQALPDDAGHAHGGVEGGRGRQHVIFLPQNFR